MSVENFYVNNLVKKIVELKMINNTRFLFSDS